MLLILLIVAAFAIVALFVFLLWVIRVIGLLESFSREDTVREEGRIGVSKGACRFLGQTVSIIATPSNIRLALEVVHKGTEILLVLRIFEESLWIVLDEVAWNLFVGLLSQIIKQLQDARMK
jgi:hypothetical protein